MIDKINMAQGIYIKNTWKVIGGELEKAPHSWYVYGCRFLFESLGREVLLPEEKLLGRMPLIGGKRSLESSANSQLIRVTLTEGAIDFVCSLDKVEVCMGLDAWESL